MSNAHTDSYPKKTTVETVTYDNIGPVPEQDPMAHSRNVELRDQDIIKDENRDLNATTESKGIVSSVVEAAKSAAYRVKEALVGEDTTRTTDYGKDGLNVANEDVRVVDDRDRNTTTTTTSDISGKSTTDKMKDTAYDVKEKVKDTAYDAKEKIKDTAHDIRDKSKDTHYDIKDKSKDTAYDIKDKTKDTAYDIKDKMKDTSRDIKDKSKDTAYDIHDHTVDTGNDYTSNKVRDTSLSADSDIVADSNKQRLRDIKEKVKDAAQAPVEMAQSMFATGKEKVKEAFPSNTATTEPVQETPGTADMFSQDYQPVPALYQTDTTSKTDQAKSKVASTAADAAGKAETWIAENKHKLPEQADKAQDLAADAKLKADSKALESGKEPANDTRYYSGVHGQTY